MGSVRTDCLIVVSAPVDIGGIDDFDVWITGEGILIGVSVPTPLEGDGGFTLSDRTRIGDQWKQDYLYLSIV